MLVLTLGELLIKCKLRSRRRTGGRASRDQGQEVGGDAKGGVGVGGEGGAGRV